jgi:hypothetical protein
MASAEDPTDRPAHGGTGEAELTAEALAQLQQRLDQASEAAERLIAEAANAACKPPPSGWQRRESQTEDDKTSTASSGQPEIDLLLEALRAVRDRIPPELQRRLGEALREVLLALRALIGWYLERTERRRAEPAEVHDIPIV